MSSRNSGNLIKDIGLIALSVLIAVILVKIDFFDDILAASGQVTYLGSFIAGLFFTSVFTTAPAIAALGEISLRESLWVTALLGGLGAMCGDYIIFRFMRDTFSEHLSGLVRTKGMKMRLKHLVRSRSFRWLTFLLGGLIIASPLPDELGLSLLGFSKIRTSWFVALSFSFNFIGIVLIGLITRSV